MTDLVTIFRIEFPETGRGPWCRQNEEGFITNALGPDRARDISDNLPLPYSDGLDLDYIGWSDGYFAFYSLSQCLNYFEERDLHRLLEVGYELQKLTISLEYLQRGYNQVLFIKDKVVKRELITLENFGEEKEKSCWKGVVY